LPFHSSRPTETAPPDGQFAPAHHEAIQPLVNLAVDRLPSVEDNTDFAVASMVLAGMNGEKSTRDAQVFLAADKRSFEDALKKNFPEKYKLLKDNAKILRLELCLPANSSLEQIAERLYKLKQGEIGRYSCRQA